MAASKELITKIVLKAQADGSISKAFSALAKNSDTCIGKLAKIGDKAKTAFKTVGAVVAAGAVAAGKAAIDFESAFAGVQKTVDETDTTSYEDLSKGIRDLAKVTPAAATEIADVAAAAGQLGIKADDILNFSKTMIDLGESTNLTSEEAATSIAKLFNVTGTSMNQVGNFGSTLVALGNNAATTESDILAMATRIAGSGKQIGLTEQQILALSTSLSSVGIEAEMGGSAISTTMSQIDKDVAKGSETLSVWAKTAGMSTKEFSAAWKSNAYGALQRVLQGMAKTKDEGGNLNLVLEDLGINAIRQGDMLKRLSSATGLMSEMTDLANASWDENSALTKEANTRYATMASRLQIAKNKITDVGITVGNALMPALDSLMKKFDEVNWDAVAEKIADKVQWVIDNFDKLKVAVGICATAFATFKIASFITTVSGAVKELKLLAEALKMKEKIDAFTAALKKTNIITSCTTAFNTAKTAITNFGIASKISTAAQWLFNTSLYGCPIVWIIAGIAALIAIIVLLVKNWDKVKEVAGKCWEGIKTGVSNAVSAVGGWFKQLPGKISNGLSSAKEKVSTWGSNLWSKTKEIGGNCVNGIGTFFGQMPEKIGNWISGAKDKITTWGSNLWAKAKEIGSNFVNGVVNFFKQLPYKLGYVIGYAIGTVIKFGISIWNFATTEIPKFIGKVVSWFAQLPGKIWTWLVNVVTKIGAWAVNMYNKMKTAVVNAINATVNFFKTLPSKIWTWLVNTVTKIGQWAVNMYNKMRTAALNAINAVVNFFRTLPSKVWTWLTSTIQKIATWGSQMLSRMRTATVNAINAVINWFRQLPSKIWTWLTNTISKIVSWGSQMVAKAKAAAKNVVTNVVNTIKQLPSKMLSIGRNIVEGLWNGIKNAKDWLVGKVKQFASGITDGIKAALGINSPSVVMEKLFKWVPIGAGNGIIENAKYAVNAVKSMGGKIASEASKISPTISTTTKLPKHGTGGTFTTPHAAIVGDRPETIVPHGNTPRNRALLSEAARGVGASSGGNVVNNFTFAPVINGGNVEENRAMLQDEQEKFARNMEAWLMKNRRLAY